MLRLSDGQLKILFAQAQEIPVYMRSAWLESIASALNNKPTPASEGDGRGDRWWHWW
jgi:hypothetical protein